jgi:hypothetical protein
MPVILLSSCLRAVVSPCKLKATHDVQKAKQGELASCPSLQQDE